MTVSLAVVSVVSALVLVPGRAPAQECTILQAQACAVERTDHYDGIIIVPGSEVANREVARTGGCAGCEWFLVVDCDPNDPEQPEGGGLVNCNAARCPDGTLYRVYLQRPADAHPGYLDSVCLSPTRRIVTVADLDADLDRYLTRLRPPEPEIGVQPARRAVVGIPTYFVARGPRTATRRLDVTTAAGPATLLIDVAATEYTWRFGDGGQCVTTAPGAPYDGDRPAERCDDQVAHVYRGPRAATVTLRATWGGTYAFDVGYGPVGPIPIPGDGVPGPATTRAVDVRPARAQLVGG